MSDTQATTPATPAPVTPPVSPSVPSTPATSAMTYWASVDPATNVVKFHGHTTDASVLAYMPHVVTITQAQHDQLAAQTSFTLINGVLAPIETQVDLDRAKQLALREIEVGAETARLNFVTQGSGQAMVYQLKAERAKAFLAAYPTTAAAQQAVATDWPNLSAEIGLTAPTLFDVAQTIDTLATRWGSAAAEIEGLRLKAKIDLNNATTIAQITASKTIAWPAS